MPWRGCRSRKKYGKLENSHSFAVNPSGGTCVLGSAAGPKSSSAVSVVVLDSGGHSVLETHQVPFPVTSLFWSKRGTLASGSSKGRVLYWTNMNNKSIRDFDLDSCHSVTVQSMKETATTPISSGEWTYSSCITQVETVQSEKLILGSENHKIHMWDVETQAHIKGVKVSSGIVQTFSCSPENDNIIATGSSTGGMKIFDTRTSTPILMTNNIKATRQIAMSPLVSHWVATSSDGGEIKIWDTRAHSTPVLTMPHHVGITVGLKWSPFHCELLSVAGACGSVKLFSSRHSPDYCISSTSLSSPCVGLSFIDNCTDKTVQNPVSTIVAASSSGEVTSMDLTPIFLDSLVQYRNLSDSCERLAYLRNLREAEKRIRTVLTEKMKSNELKPALKVASLLHNYVPEELSKDCGSQRFIEAFKTDLDGCTKQLPPLMRYSRSTILKNLELKLAILNWTANKEYHLVTRKIMEMLRPSDPDDDNEDEEETLIVNLIVSLTPEVYQAIVNSLTKHTWSVGCDFVLRTASQDQINDIEELEPSLLISIITKLIGDTVRVPKTVTEALERLQLLRRVCEATVNHGASASKYIINIVNEAYPSPVTMLADTSTVQMYASSLMFIGRTAQCVWFVDSFCKLHPEPAANYAREVLGRLIVCVTSRYSSKLSGENKRMSQKKSVIKGRAFVQGMQATISFTSEMAITCRMLIQEAFDNSPMPESSGPFHEVLSLASTCAEKMRVIATQTLRQVDALGAAVRQECRPIVTRYTNELAAAIDSAPRRDDFDAEPNMKQLMSQAFTHCEVLHTTLSNHLEEE
eukprot:TRINITY_DN11157_c0_g1_i1.p1 TRINITY_DN11157_c0_g1~~TRINITY_DN11157_c0_g1_i1.p1  ORF type:complete len:806 (+),score=126.29 TRINITY_DN11157_c0_g1_i1:118-2535(+)